MQGPWRTVEDVELATLSWAHWWNTQRLHSAIGDVPPAEFEAAHYAGSQLAGTTGEHQTEPPTDPVRFSDGEDWIQGGV